MPQPRLPSGFEQHIVEPAGLDLASDPLDSDCLRAHNVTFRSKGRVRARPGTQRVSGTLSTNAYGVAAIQTAANVIDVVTRTGAALVAYSIGGAAPYSFGTNPDMSGSAFIGTPTTSALYIGRAMTAGLVKYIPGTGFAAATLVPKATPPDPNLADVAAYPRAFFLAVTPWDNRLVVANTDLQGTPGTANPSRVGFSGPGKPDTWQENHFVDLTPGDNEPILGMVSWRDKVFVFKQTKYFVFYSTTSDGDGNPVFNYTAVHNRPGIFHRYTVDKLAGATKACAGRMGVYYIGSDGVYRTTGTDSVRVSAPLEPLFEGEVPTYWDAGEALMNTGEACIAAGGGKVYVALRLRHADGPTILVFDEDTGNWAVWEIPLETATINSWFIGGLTPIVDVTDPFAQSDGLVMTLNWYEFSMWDAAIVRTNPSIATDQNVTSTPAAFSTTYHTGLLDMGTVNEKVLREVEIQGSGTTVDVAVRTPSGVDSTTACTFTSGGIETARHRKSYRGRWFQAQASGAALTINRIITRLNASSRGPGVDQA